MSYNSLPEHPAEMVRDLLIERWDASKVYDLDPSIPWRESDGLALSRGWYDTFDASLCIGLTNFSEPRPSTSGYTGIDPTGKGPTQHRSGSGLATVFVAEKDGGYTDQNVTADVLSTALRFHVEGIIADAMADDDLPDPLTYISTAWEDSNVDTDDRPPVWWEQIGVSYAWERGPE